MPILADQRAKNQTATHLPDNFKNRNILLTIDKKIKHFAIVALNDLS
jgi:hypothetical protein